MNSETNTVFSRWPFAPGFDEGPHGYRMRLIKANGLMSVRSFNIWNGIDSDKANPEASLALLESHPLPKEWMTSLKWATLVKRDRIAYLAGQQMAFNHAHVGKRRFCRGCLHENPYHRTWWDIVSIRRCPFHGARLELDEGFGGWNWPDFAMDRNGVPYGRSMARGNFDGFARYALGRMGYLPAMKVPGLDQHTLGSVIEASEWLGRALNNPRSTVVPILGDEDIDTGFLLLCAGTREIVDEWCRWLDRNQATVDGGETLYSVIGWPIKTLWMVRSPDLREVLRGVTHEVRARRLNRVGDRPIHGESSSSYLTVPVIARKLGIREAGVHEIVKELGIAYRGRARSISETDVPKIEAFRQSLLSPTEVSRKLGLPDGCLRNLVCAGYLKVFHGTLGPNAKSRSARYSPRDVANIHGIIARLPIHGKLHLGRSIWTYRLNGTRRGIGAIVLDVLEGKIPIVGRRKNVAGVLGLLVECPPPQPRPRMPPGKITLSDAQCHLNMSQATTAHLVDMGLLGPVVRRKSLTLLQLEHVAEFGRGHARLADFARAMHRHPTPFWAEVVQMGVVAVLRRGHPKGAECIVRRSDVIQALSLPADPTKIDDLALGTFWADFRRLFLLDYPQAILPYELPAGGQRVVLLGVSIVFNFDASARELHVTIYFDKRPQCEMAFGMVRHTVETDVASFVEEVHREFRIVLTRRRERWALQTRTLKEAKQAKLSSGNTQSSRDSADDT